MNEEWRICDRRDHDLTYRRRAGRYHVSHDGYQRFTIPGSEDRLNIRYRAVPQAAGIISRIGRKGKIRNWKWAILIHILKDFLAVCGRYRPVGIVVVSA